METFNAINLCSGKMGGRFIPPFDEATHTYYNAEGMPVPSVSQILSMLGVSGDFSGISKFYAHRGTITHKGIELILSGLHGTEWFEEEMNACAAQCPEAKIEDASPYIASFLKLHEEVNFVPAEDGLEMRFLSPCGRYAGTADLVGATNGIAVAVFDWKTSKEIGRNYHLQVGGAYCTALGFPDGYIVHLHGDGSKADLIKADDDAREVWAKLVDIYYSDLSDEKKKQQAKLVAMGTVRIDEELAKKFAEAKAEEKKAEADVKKAKKVCEPIETEIKARMQGRPGNYNCPEYEIVGTPIKGRESKDIEGFLKYLTDTGHDDLVAIFNKQFVSEGAPSYRLDYKPAEEKKERAKRSSKKEKKSEAGIPATDTAPERPVAGVADSGFAGSGDTAMPQPSVVDNKPECGLRPELSVKPRELRLAEKADIVCSRNKFAKIIESLVAQGINKEQAKFILSSAALEIGGKGCIELHSDNTWHTMFTIDQENAVAEAVKKSVAKLSTQKPEEKGAPNFDPESPFKNDCIADPEALRRELDGILNQRGMIGYSKKAEIAITRELEKSLETFTESDAEYARASYRTVSSEYLDRASA